MWRGKWTVTSQNFLLHVRYSLLLVSDQMWRKKWTISFQQLHLLGNSICFLSTSVTSDQCGGESGLRWLGTLFEFFYYFESFTNIISNKWWSLSISNYIIYRRNMHFMISKSSVFCDLMWFVVLIWKNSCTNFYRHFYLNEISILIKTIQLCVVGFCHGYNSKSHVKEYDKDCLQNEDLLTSSRTGFQISYLYSCVL